MLYISSFRLHKHVEACLSSIQVAFEANLASIKQCYSDPSTSAEEVVERLQMTRRPLGRQVLEGLEVQEPPVSEGRSEELSKSVWRLEVSLEALRRHQHVSLRESEAPQELQEPKIV